MPAADAVRHLFFGEYMAVQEYFRRKGHTWIFVEICRKKLLLDIGLLEYNVNKGYGKIWINCKKGETLWRK